MALPRNSEYNLLKKKDTTGEANKQRYFSLAQEKQKAEHSDLLHFQQGAVQWWHHCTFATRMPANYEIGFCTSDQIQIFY